MRFTVRGNAALKIVGIYVVVGAMWILFSDRVADRLLGGTRFLLLANSAKGMVYVIVTGALLYWLIIGHREALGRQAYEAQRLALVGRLAAGVAHDFNNLLSAILGLCRLVREDVAAGQVHAEDLVEIEEVANHGAALAARLLLLGQHGEVRPERTDVGAAIQGAERLLRRSSGAKVRLDLELEAQTFALIDPVQLEQVVLNLALNARDAMPDGGQLTVRVRRDREVVRLAVIDTGVGMDAVTVARVFEPFYSTKKDEASRFGIGLASVDEIVRQAGGRIEVASQPGQGTTFEVVLPAVA